MTSDWKRDYPYNGLLRTMIGSISDSNEGLPKSLLDHYLSLGYNRNDRVGKSYLEAEYENVLQGQKEKVKNITDKSGDIVDTEVISEGKSGKDLVLTIDVDMQKAIEKIIEDELKSAKARHSAPLLDRAFVVMMDPRNGEVLSIAGKQLKNESGKLKVDDYALGAMTSSYAMGSAVKGATVLTGLQTGAINLNTTFLDEPLYIGKGNPKKSWASNLGTLGIQERLKNLQTCSCLKRRSPLVKASIRRASRSTFKQKHLIHSGIISASSASASKPESICQMKQQATKDLKDCLVSCLTIPSDSMTHTHRCSWLSMYQRLPMAGTA